MEESCGAEGKEQVNKALNGQLYNADLDLQREAKRLITHLTDKVLQFHHQTEMVFLKMFEMAIEVITGQTHI